MIHRASSLGGCLKSQIAAALGMKPIPHDEMSTLRMGEGQLHEDDVVARLLIEGAGITQQQEEVNLVTQNYPIGIAMDAIPGLVQGHLDGIIETGDWRGSGIHRHRVLEIKSMGDTPFKAFKAKGWEAGGLIDRYKWQISVYMIATGLEAYVVAKNRNSGELLRHGVEMPFHSLEDITERVAYIEDHVSRGQLPDDCPHDFFCDYKYLCQSKAPVVDEDEPVNDPIFESRLSEYVRLGDAIKAFEALRSELKADIDAWMKLAGRQKARVGDYSVTWVTREIPESVRKASTQSFPQVKKVTDVVQEEG